MNTPKRDMIEELAASLTNRFGETFALGYFKSLVEGCVSESSIAFHLQCQRDADKKVTA